MYVYCQFTVCMHSWISCSIAHKYCQLAITIRLSICALSMCKLHLSILRKYNSMYSSSHGYSYKEIGKSDILEIP